MFGFSLFCLIGWLPKYNCSVNKMIHFQVALWILFVSLNILSLCLLTLNCTFIDPYELYRICCHDKMWTIISRRKFVCNINAKLFHVWTQNVWSFFHLIIALLFWTFSIKLCACSSWKTSGKKDIVYKNKRGVWKQRDDIFRIILIRYR